MLVEIDQPGDGATGGPHRQIENPDEVGGGAHRSIRGAPNGLGRDIA